MKNTTLELGLEKISVKVSIDKRQIPQFLIGILFIEAEEEGVSLIHGNSSSFYVSFEEIFREIYNYFSKTKIEEININHLSSKLREIIDSVKRKTEKNVKKEDDLSPCSKVNNIGDIFVKKLPAPWNKYDWIEYQIVNCY